MRLPFWGPSAEKPQCFTKALSMLTFSIANKFLTLVWCFVVVMHSCKSLQSHEADFMSWKCELKGFLYISSPFLPSIQETTVTVLLGTYKGGNRTERKWGFCTVKRFPILSKVTSRSTQKSCPPVVKCPLGHWELNLMEKYCYTIVGCLSYTKRILST